MEFAAAVTVITIRYRTLGGGLAGATVKLQERKMTLGNLFSQTGRNLAIGAAILGAVGLTALSRPAHALSPAAGVGIGLGAFAAGTALGSAANPYYNPYYSPYGYGSYYPSAPAYYPATPYYQPRSCWDPYYRRYYAC